MTSPIGLELAPELEARPIARPFVASAPWGTPLFFVSPSGRCFLWGLLVEQLQQHYGKRFVNISGIYFFFLTFLFLACYAV